MFFNFNNFCIISNVVHTQFTSQSQATCQSEIIRPGLMFTQQKIDSEELFDTNFTFQFQDWLQGPEWIRSLDQAWHRSRSCVCHDGWCMGRVTRLSGRGSRGSEWRQSGCDHPWPRHEIHTLQCGPGGQGQSMDEHLLQPLCSGSGKESSPRDHYKYRVIYKLLSDFVNDPVCNNLANYNSFIYLWTFL